MDISKEQYLQNPCRTASLPYWKAISVSIPDYMKIAHEEEFSIDMLREYRDERYFRFKLLELLRRMKNAAEFVTVSGRCDNPADPESLYRRCGFRGSDVWHILRKE